MLKALDWAYDQAIEGVPGLGSAEEMAREYQKAGGSVQDQVNSLIRWQVSKAATAGFVTNLGGLLTLPVALPANFTSVAYLQLKMIAAIAILGGHDVRDDKVQTLAYLCLLGNAGKDVLKELGIKVGTNLARKGIENISRSLITKINQAIGFRVITKFGEKGAINLGKLIPFFGGGLAALLDGLATNTIGDVARDTFIDP